MKLIFIKKNFSFHGGAENYMKTLIDRLKDKADIHVMAGNWFETSDITFHKINHLSLSSFLSVITFNRNACNMTIRLRRTFDADCVISFERTTCQDIYRAGDGCHREWLKLREMIEPRWKKYISRINPLHIALLRIEKKLFSNTKLIIANSNMVKRQIINHYNIPEEKIKVIYNGVDTKRFSKNTVSYRSWVRKELSIHEDSNLILFVGSGFERKGLKTLLRAISIINQKKTDKSPHPPFTKGGITEKDIKLIVIGRGNIKKFKSIAKEYGIADRVLFLGPQTNIERFYAASDVFVLPTIYDPFSNATLEAMATGLPVITTKNNGASELIRDEEEGFVINNPLDYKTLSERILLALSKKDMMGQKARLKAEEYPIEKAAMEFMEFFT
jgi:UDP-glucose:(heptosyl)LPS alpha-1,3-glucosyltransferase